MTSQTIQKWALWIFGAFILVGVLYGTFYLLSGITMPAPTLGSAQSTSINLVVVILITLVFLLATLSAMAFLFQKIGLSDPKEALGLPSGSIQALIALFVLILFALFTIYLFYTVSESSNQNANSFALQIFTALVTLATAVTSFYFATKVTSDSNNQLTRSSRPAPLTITEITPNSGAAANGKLFIKDLSGTGFVNDTKVKLKKGDAEIVGTEVEAISDTRLQCFFDLAGQDAGDWDVIVTNPDQTEKTLREGFEIK